MTPKRSKSWGPEYAPSSRAKLPQPLVVMVRDEDGQVLETREVSVIGSELAQEVLTAVWGAMQIHKRSYVEVRTEEEVHD